MPEAETKTDTHSGKNLGHFACLDGLRGVAAFWVFVSHVLILCGSRWIPIVSSGGLAVDLFMMLSGFLMTYHYVLRRAKEPWGDPSTWIAFWFRRFFRIAPLYYVLLLVAIAMGPYLGVMREAIGSVWPNAATNAARYSDNSITNLVAHITFLFGVLPNYSFQTPLPDWSIGLEMQFYAAFPFLMLAVGRFGILRTSIVLLIMCFGVLKMFEGYIGLFEMPSLLPMKMHMFLIGIWLAIGLKQNRIYVALLASVLTALASSWILADAKLDSAARIGMVIAVFYLIDSDALPRTIWLGRLVSSVRTLFGSKAAVFLGDTSYGFYLLHLLILIPIAGHLARFPAYQVAPSLARIGLCVLLAAPITYIVAWVLHRILEKRGISLGRIATSRLQRT